MNTQFHEAVGADEIVIANGNGANGGVLTRAEAIRKIERIVFAKGMKQLPLELIERYEAVLEAQAAKVKERLDLNVKKAIEMAEKRLRTNLEIAEPINIGPPLYKWWDVFVEGPIQNITLPPFLPHKVIRAGELVIFNAFVVTNPMSMFGGPSARTVLNGRPFTLRAFTCNLRTCTAGPSIAVTSAFNLSGVQSFALAFIFVAPPQGSPDLYEVNVTLDVIDAFQQPDAGFATRLSDIDTDPSMGTRFTFPITGLPADVTTPPHVHSEQPMRFLVYTA